MTARRRARGSCGSRRRWRSSPSPWTLAVDVVGEGRGVLRASRGFYGVLRVVREEPGQPDEYVKLLHGQITHGLQLSAPSRRAELTTYYGPSSGAGLAIRRHPKRLAGRPMRVGVIGLGVGTLAAWSRPGDVFRFYEIDPEVARLSEGSRPVFTYLRDARGEVSVSLGDGRLVLEREAPQAFDVLVVDAFSSDAIPTHLLTREAFGVYLRHLAEGGVLAVHVTNRYVDLKPVVRGAAARARAPRGARPVVRAEPPVVVRLDAGGPRPRPPRGRGRERGDAAPPRARGRRRLDGRLERPPGGPEALTRPSHFFLAPIAPVSGTIGRSYPTGSPVCLRPRRGANR